MITSRHIADIRVLFILCCIALLGAGLVRYFLRVIPNAAHAQPTPAIETAVPKTIAPKPKSFAPPEPTSVIPHEEPQEPRYTIGALAPIDGAIDDFSMIIQECHHTDDAIICSAQATNHTDARTRLTGCCGTSVDDEGNSAQVRFGFAGFQQFLIPGVVTNVPFKIYDRHQSAKSVNFELHMGWEADQSSYQILVYKDVPVQ